MEPPPKPLVWPFDLPIWRSHHEAASPDGRFVARIDPAIDISMGNPTFGILCVSQGLHIPRCNPSFIWSDDSRYLVVPKFIHWLGWFTRQRLLIIDFKHPGICASKMTAWYFQPETFNSGTLVATKNPSGRKRTIEFKIPADLDRAFKPYRIFWPEMPYGHAH